MAPLKTDFKKDVVYVYQFPRSLVIPSLSPYCLKLETWLRLADINYEVKVKSEDVDSLRLYKRKTVLTQTLITSFAE